MSTMTGDKRKARAEFPMSRTIINRFNAIMQVCQAAYSQTPYVLPGKWHPFHGNTVLASDDHGEIVMPVIIPAKYFEKRPSWQALNLALAKHPGERIRLEATERLLHFQMQLVQMYVLLHEAAVGNASNGNGVVKRMRLLFEAIHPYNSSTKSPDTEQEPIAYRQILVVNGKEAGIFIEDMIGRVLALNAIIANECRTSSLRFYTSYVDVMKDVGYYHGKLEDADMANLVSEAEKVPAVSLVNYAFTYGDSDAPRSHLSGILQPHHYLATSNGMMDERKDIPPVQTKCTIVGFPQTTYEVLLGGFSHALYMCMAFPHAMLKMSRMQMAFLKKETDFQHRTEEYLQERQRVKRHNEESDNPVPDPDPVQFLDQRMQPGCSYELEMIMRQEWEMVTGERCPYELTRCYWMGSGDPNIFQTMPARHAEIRDLVGDNYSGAASLLINERAGRFSTQLLGHATSSNPVSYEVSMQELHSIPPRTHITRTENVAMEIQKRTNIPVTIYGLQLWLGEDGRAKLWTTRNPRLLKYAHEMFMSVVHPKMPNVDSLNDAIAREYFSWCRAPERVLAIPAYKMQFARELGSSGSLFSERMEIDENVLFLHSQHRYEAMIGTAMLSHGIDELTMHFWFLVLGVPGIGKSYLSNTLRESLPEGFYSEASDFSQLSFTAQTFRSLAVLLMDESSNILSNTTAGSDGARSATSRGNAGSNSRSESILKTLITACCLVMHHLYIDQATQERKVATSHVTMILTALLNCNANANIIPMPLLARMLLVYFVTVVRMDGRLPGTDSHLKSELGQQEMKRRHYEHTLVQVCNMMRTAGLLPPASTHAVETLFAQYMGQLREAPPLEVNGMLTPCGRLFQRIQMDAQAIVTKRIITTLYLTEDAPFRLTRVGQEFVHLTDPRALEKIRELNWCTLAEAAQAFSSMSEELASPVMDFLGEVARLAPYENPPNLDLPGVQVIPLAGSASANYQQSSGSTAGVVLPSSAGAAAVPTTANQASGSGSASANYRQASGSTAGVVVPASTGTTVVAATGSGSAIIPVGASTTAAAQQLHGHGALVQTTLVPPAPPAASPPGGNTTNVNDAGLLQVREDQMPKLYRFFKKDEPGCTMQRFADEIIRKAQEQRLDGMVFNNDDVQQVQLGIGHLQNGFILIPHPFAGRVLPRNHTDNTGMVQIPSVVYNHAKGLYVADVTVGTSHSHYERVIDLLCKIMSHKYEEEQTMLFGAGMARKIKILPRTVMEWFDEWLVAINRNRLPHRQVDIPMRVREEMLKELEEAAVRGGLHVSIPFITTYRDIKPTNSVLNVRVVSSAEFLREMQKHLVSFGLAGLHSGVAPRENEIPNEIEPEGDGGRILFDMFRRHRGVLRTLDVPFDQFALNEHLTTINGHPPKSWSEEERLREYARIRGLATGRQYEVKQLTVSGTGERRWSICLKQPEYKPGERYPAQLVGADVRSKMLKQEGDKRGLRLCRTEWMRLEKEGVAYPTSDITQTVGQLPIRYSADQAGMGSALTGSQYFGYYTEGDSCSAALDTQRLEQIAAEQRRMEEVQELPTDEDAAATLLQIQQMEDDATAERQLHASDDSSQSREAAGVGDPDRVMEEPSPVSRSEAVPAPAESSQPHEEATVVASQTRSQQERPSTPPMTRFLFSAFRQASREYMDSEQASDGAGEEEEEEQ